MSKLKKFGALIFFLSIWLLLYSYWYFKERKLQKNSSIVIGTIKGCIQPRGGTYIKYGFYFKDEYFTGSSIDLNLKSCNQVYELEKVSKYIPIIVYEENPDLNRAILSRDSFKKYHVNYPDSLESLLEAFELY